MNGIGYFFRDDDLFYFALVGGVATRAYSGKYALHMALLEAGSLEDALAILRDWDDQNINENYHNARMTSEESHLALRQLHQAFRGKLIWAGPRASLEDDWLKDRAYIWKREELYYAWSNYAPSLTISGIDLRSLAAKMTDWPNAHEVRVPGH